MAHKFNTLIELMNKLSKGEELTINQDLAEELDVSLVNLSRYLDEIYRSYKHLIKVEKKKNYRHPRKPNVYCVRETTTDFVEVLKFFTQKSNDLEWILQLLYRENPRILDKYENIKKRLSKDNDTYLFKSQPFEQFDIKSQRMFFTLKIAVNNNEYISMVYKNTELETLKDVKPLKMVFTDNNWYVAVSVENKVRLLRVIFIESLFPGSKSTYQKKSMSRQLEFLENRLQNAMTKDNGNWKVARCRASPTVARYFRQGMKPFFDSQKFLSEDDQGNVEFEIGYSQPLEILPFIKRWLPDLEVLAPTSLLEILKHDLKSALQKIP